MSKRVPVLGPRQQMAQQKEAYRLRNTPTVHVQDLRDRRGYRTIVAQVSATIAAGEVGSVLVEVGGTTGESIPVENVHNADLEAGLRVFLLDTHISEYLIPVPFAYTACEQPDSPTPIGV